MMFEMFTTTASYVQILSIAEMIETEAGQSLVTNVTMSLSLCQVTINFMQSKVKTMLHSLDDKNTIA